MQTHIVQGYICKHTPWGKPNHRKHTAASLIVMHMMMMMRQCSDDGDDDDDVEKDVALARHNSIHIKG